MRIVLAKTQLMGPISGADEILVTYATQLRKSGRDVSVLLLFPCQPQDSHYLRLKEAEVPLVTIASTPVRATLEAGRSVARKVMDALPLSKKLLRKRAHKISTRLTFKYQQRCAEALRELRADVMHVVTPDPGAMALIRAAHAAGVPALYHEMGMPYHPPGFEFSYREFTSVLPLCAEVAALSPSLARHCREQLPDLRRLSVLPMIVNDLRDGRPAGDGGAAINVGFAARFEHLKGPLTLLEAFAVARRSDARLRLVFAGAGSLEPKLKSRAAVLGVAGHCEFAGRYASAEQRKAFMERLDIFALPSLTEGTPNSIAEAMSFGVPVIASDVGGIPDTLTAQSGVLVSPGDVAALADALVSVAKDSDARRRMGRAARERYETLFSPQAVLPTLLSVYRRVAGRGEQAPESDLHPWAQVS